MTLFFLTSLAFAVPLQVTQQGRILDSTGSAVAGTHSLTFRVYDAPVNGNITWSETLAVTFQNGYYSAILGTDTQGNPLDSSVLQQYPLYMEFQLDSNAPMTPRQPLNSAPYAQMAGIAKTARPCMYTDR